MTLNEAERETLNAAMAILERCTAQGATFHVYVDHMRGHPVSHSISYFDSTYRAGKVAGHHSLILGETLADKVQNALDIEAYVQSQREVV